MTQDERDSMYIANCKACTLAECMKDCKSCLFNIGLPFKVTIKQEAQPEVKQATRDNFLVFAQNYLKNVPNGAK